MISIVLNDVAYHRFLNFHELYFTSYVLRVAISDVKCVCFLMERHACLARNVIYDTRTLMLTKLKEFMVFKVLC